MSEERRQRILTALTRELDRQASADRSDTAGQGGERRFVLNGGALDLVALATAIDAALGADTLEAGLNPANTNGPEGAGSSPKGAYSAADEGKRPDELDASNDE
ncbi:MAG TPA: hypothetical protein VL418_10380 [Devosiaceae bacterium]|jgi:hypothetical protein|nr:hypothetical protein [Devosiaceae bacterium]